MSSKNSNPTISNEQSTTLRLDIQGRVSFETVEPLMKEFLTSIKSLSTGEIILNLEKVEYLDSAGAGMIVRLRQEC
jgi:anti-anti-sigma factor